MKFIPGVEQTDTGQTAYWFAFRGDKLLISTEQNKVTLPCAVTLACLEISPLRTQYLGSIDGKPCCSAELADGTVTPEGMAFIGLRQLFGMIEGDLFAVAGLARQIIEWDKTHQYCGKCGGPTSTQVGERAKICPHCDLISFPRISPAIIVALTKGDELLLARGNRFAVPMYSVIAGFVEAGETLEECVKREVKEEVGLDVDKITYFGSQAWPFPNSLMIGFTAQYAGGEINIDPSEILDAQWFKADNLPLIP